MSESPSAVEQDRPESPAQPTDMYAWYREMRAAQPVSYDAQRRVWHVFRYDDVQRVLNDYSTFSSELARLRPQEQSEDRPRVGSLIFSDPPQHRKLRALVTQAFTPQTVAALEPRIAQIADELLDAVSPAGRMELIGDLAEPLPVIVIAELLGIPTDRRADFKRWSDAIVEIAASNVGALASGATRSSAQFDDMRQYMISAIEQRRAQPQQDLISQLLVAQVDGQTLTRDEVMAFVSLLLVAGNETTTNLLGNAILCFDEHPEVWAQLRADPTLLPGAIEEVLRYRGPVRSLFRLVTRDTEIGGQAIPAGSLVMFWLASANHDPAQFAEPERFDITRAPNRHLAFGHGIHFCLGAPLSRLETRVVLEIMLRRFAELRVAADQPVEKFSPYTLDGVKRLPVTFRLA